MQKREKIVAANWKMNCLRDEAGKLAMEVSAMVLDEIRNDVRIILAPPVIYLSYVDGLVHENKKIELAAQNCAAEKSGAFTGEISAAMIRSAGAKYVIIGHSERRILFYEKDVLLAKKVNTAIGNELNVIFCCGETIDERSGNTHFKVVEQQLEIGLFHLDESNLKKCCIAYEPVWAIGTGATATPAQAQEMHLYIRGLIRKKFNPKTADSVSILYGGSCNENNASELFSLPDVDGGLIGGASLKARSFVNIIKAI